MLRRLISTFATPGLPLGLALVMAALYGADRFLANLEMREIGAPAGRSRGVATAAGRDQSGD